MKNKKKSEVLQGFESLTFWFYHGLFHKTDYKMTKKLGDWGLNGCWFKNVSLFHLLWQVSNIFPQLVLSVIYESFRLNFLRQDSKLENMDQYS